MLYGAASWHNAKSQAIEYKLKNKEVEQSQAVDSSAQSSFMSNKLEL